MVSYGVLLGAGEGATRIEAVRLVLVGASVEALCTAVCVGGGLDPSVSARSICYGLLIVP